MNIAHHTPDRLVLRLHRWKFSAVCAAILLVLARLAYLASTSLPGGWIVSILILGIPGPFILLMAVLSHETVTLTLDAGSQTANLRHGTRKGLYNNTWPLDRIAGIRIANFHDLSTEASTDKQACVPQLIVTSGMDAGHIPLTSLTLKWSQVSHLQDTVATWLTNQRLTALDSTNPQP